MDISSYNSDLFSFLECSPTPFHAIEQLKIFFTSQGFLELREGDSWSLERGKSYFVSRQQGALISFTLGSEEQPTDGFRIVTSHSDSPCLQLKPQPSTSNNGYAKLGVELYGGALLAPWFDRDLTLAGRVTCSLEDGSLRTFLVDFKRPLITIPSVAIHLNRDANSSASINKQKDLPPVMGLSQGEEQPSFDKLIARYLEEYYPASRIKEILSHDLFCVDTNRPTLLGIQNELISAARLDNLLSTHACAKAIADADRTLNSMFYVANHEENGSMSAAGAHGNFLESICNRILPEIESRARAMSNSFLISVDNAHATHPNAPDTMDPGHNIELNKGVVIKVNANQRYTSNSISSAIYKQICQKAEVGYQEFVMRSDMPCGSTIGPLASAGLGVQSIDIGAPTLGMHSIREITGDHDPEMVYRSLVSFFATNIHTQLLNQ